ncbi:nucleolar zinc-finger protein [Mycoemilia scoparia]|uniref:Nucleolar zinc-finger protein n=1 Tax=Mycoemilia scoparia TaxID=417184 RepID=A0A9W8A3D3_9FUNG|nr:nucleolar zinc-finger protein [Mycoemilia scoparia]
MSQQNNEDANKSGSKKRLFEEISGESMGNAIESLCMNCHEQGTTRMLLTRIPHFKDIILMAFECPHCGLKNNEVQSGEAIQEKGIEYSCKIDSKQDLDRQIVRAESAVVIIPEIELEIPGGKSGQLTTVEGLLQGIIHDLSMDQPERKEKAPNVYEAIEKILATIKGYMEKFDPFTLKLSDPSGNSYIENLHAPMADPKLHAKQFRRNAEQNQALGLQTPEVEEEREKESREKLEKTLQEASHHDEIISFPANCSSCNAPSETRMKMFDIPHFKEVIIMSTTCDHCGYKSNEVKSGGAISAKGTRITLKLVDEEDLSRDLLKSETCGLRVPEIDLDLTPGTLGGRFTTVEGLLRQVHDELVQKIPFVDGDSVVNERKAKFKTFLEKLDNIVSGNSFPCTLIIDDPVSNSYLQNLYAPDPDPNMTIEEYERTWDQNEDLGLNDIDV